jgi:biotin carboxylase
MDYDRVVNMKAILIAGAGANQLGIFTKAQEMGLRVIAMDGNPDAPGLPLADMGLAGNICDANEIIDVAREYSVDGIYPAAELSVEAVSEAVHRLQMPGVPPQVARRVRDKFEMRKALVAAGLPNPKFFGCTTLVEAKVAAAQLRYPFIIKPADANSSKGVLQITSDSELEDGFNQAIVHSQSSMALLEEYMEGTEYCVDGLVWQGDYIPGGITGKMMSPLPHRFDLGIFMPPLESVETCKTLDEFAAHALDAIGFDTGTTHLEIMLTKDGPMIVEMAGRPGGGRIPTDLIPDTYGMDFMADSLRIALGEAPREQRHYEKGVALYWIDAAPGRVSRIEGLEEAKGVQGVKEIVLHTQPDEVLEPIVDCVTRDSVGYVYTEGETAEEALERAQRACSLCNVITEPME